MKLSFKKKKIKKLAGGSVEEKKKKHELEGIIMALCRLTLS